MRTNRSLHLGWIAAIAALGATGCFEVDDDPDSCVCPEIYAPVCGVDGNTYGNACEAECAEVAVRSEGECPTMCDDVVCTLYCENGFKTGPDGCSICECNDDRCRSNEDCRPGQYCDFGGTPVPEPRPLPAPDAAPSVDAGVAAFPAPPPPCTSDAECAPYGFVCRFDARCAAFGGDEPSGAPIEDPALRCPGTCGPADPPVEGVCRDRTGCEPVTCRLYCEFGFKVGADGCEICECNEPPSSCSTVLCAPGHHCVEECGGMPVPAGDDADEAPGARPAPPYCRATCVPDEPGTCFSDLDCAPGQTCNTYCAPCLPDAPPDSCPCTSVCEGPVCEPVLCDLYCEFGFRVDERGCETCACNEPPAVCHDDSECGADEQCVIDACPGCYPGAPPEACRCTGHCEPRGGGVGCEAVLCAPGTYCVEECSTTCRGPGGDDGGAGVPCREDCRVACVPEEPPAVCYEDSECADGEICEIVACPGCAPGSPPEACRCFGYCEPREPLGCEAVLCAPGTHCEERCTTVCPAGGGDDGHGGRPAVPCYEECSPACVSDEPTECPLDCGPGDYCSLCWGRWACIPEGAVC